MGRIGLWTNSAFWSSGPCRGCSPHATVMNTDVSTANQTLSSRACTDARKDATRSSGPQRSFGRLGVPGPKSVGNPHGVPGPWPWFFPPRLAAPLPGQPGGVSAAPQQKACFRPREAAALTVQSCSAQAMQREKASRASRTGRWSSACLRRCSRPSNWAGLQRQSSCSMAGGADSPGRVLDESSS